MPAHLRVYSDLEQDETIRQEPSVHVSLGDLLPLIALAHRKNYVWLQDFENDRLMVSNDLYEVIRAFSNCRPSA